MKKIKLHIIHIIALLSAFSGPLTAQTSIVEGHVKDGAAGDPLSGINIYIWSSSLKPALQTIADETGYYTFTGIPSGDTYTVSVAVEADAPVGSYRVFVTSPGTNTVDFWLNAVIDKDGNYYSVVELGTQVWIGENLKVTKYNNGDPIVTTADLYYEIGAESEPKYQWARDGIESTVPRLGRLYTWYAVTDTRGVCPTGWKVPNSEEWTELIEYSGGEITGGEKLKSPETHHLYSPGPTNETGFSALMNGHRSTKTFRMSGQEGLWWTSDESSLIDAYLFATSMLGPGIVRNDQMKNFAVSVRCIKTLPTVTISPISNITPVSAISGGNVTGDGEMTVTARGICWNASPNPEISNSYTNNGSGIGSFISNITGLAPNTTYYVRAYATNSVGTAYGAEINFTTLKADSIATGTEQSNSGSISETKLGVIYPNPTRNGITIDYEIADDVLNSGKVVIQVYDITGRVIGSLVNETLEPGRYSTTWNGPHGNGTPVSRGIYYIRFSAGGVNEVKQIMLVR